MAHLRKTPWIPPRQQTPAQSRRQTSCPPHCRRYPLWQPSLAGAVDVVTCCYVVDGAWKVKSQGVYFSLIAFSVRISSTPRWRRPWLPRSVSSKHGGPGLPNLVCHRPGCPPPNDRSDQIRLSGRACCSTVATSVHHNDFGRREFRNCPRWKCLSSMHTVSSSIIWILIYQILFL